MEANRNTLLVAVAALALLAGAASAQTVDAVVRDLPIGSTGGAPSGAVGPDGFLHVVYSRTNHPTQATRSDLYYVRIDLSKTPPQVSPEVCLTAGEGTWTGNTERYSPVKTPKNTSFHMFPRIALDSGGRAHVVFAGHGDRRDPHYDDVGWRYNTQLSYLNFLPSQVLGGGAVSTCEVLVNNCERDPVLDDLLGPSPDGYWSGFEYGRATPNLCLEQTSSGGTIVHVVFSSASAAPPPDNWDWPHLRLSYLKFGVDASSGSRTSGLTKRHLDDAAGQWGLAGWWAYQVAGRPFPLGNGGVQIIGAGDFLKDDDADARERGWGHYVLGSDGSLLLPTLYGTVRTTWSRFSCAVDAAGTLHTGEVEEDPYDEQLFRVAIGDGDATRSYEAISASYGGVGNWGRGAACIGTDFYCVSGGPSLQFLDRSESVPVFHGYSLGTRSADGECCDLVVSPYTDADGKTLLAAIHATDLDGTVSHEVRDISVTGNLRLSLFRVPDPDSDVVALIASPQDGAYIPSGRVTFTAWDGAPGDDERYYWYDGGKSIGEGRSLTINPKRGIHPISLRVVRGGREDWDEITLYYGVQPPNPPTPGITVSPTSGLVTTEEPGGTATFTIVLDTQPTQDVSIGLSSSDTTEGTVSPSAVVFSPANWSIPQTVTVTGVDDTIVDGNVPYTILTAAASIGDTNYTLDPADVSVTNLDNEAPPGGGTWSSVDRPMPIPDLGSTTSTITVPGSFNVSGATVALSVSHPRTADLRAVLSSPGAPPVVLFEPGGFAASVTTSAFNGRAAGGTWSLKIEDTKRKQDGTLSGWSLTLGAAPPSPGTAASAPSGATATGDSGVPASATGAGGGQPSTGAGGEAGATGGSGGGGAGASSGTPPSSSGSGKQDPFEGRSLTDLPGSGDKKKNAGPQGGIDGDFGGK